MTEESSRIFGAVACLILASACTRPNPDFCAETSECPNGLMCEVATNRCVEQHPDAGVADAGRRCDPTAPFTDPTLATDLSSSIEEVDLSLTSDELTAVIARQSPDPAFVIATRASPSVPFTSASEPSPVADIMAINGLEILPTLSVDGLAIYFERTITMPEPPSYGVFTASRATPTAMFGNDREVLVDGVALKGTAPLISRDGMTLYWWDYLDRRIHAATRDAVPFRFSSSRIVTTMEVTPSFTVSADELSLYYSASEVLDVFVSSRASHTDPFTVGTLVPQVNSAALDGPLAATDDDCLLYLTSERSGGADVWVSRRGP